MRDVDPDVDELTTDFGGGAASWYGSIRREQRNRSVLRPGAAYYVPAWRLWPKLEDFARRGCNL
jgi:hypothetical protein